MSYDIFSQQTRIEKIANLLDAGFELLADDRDFLVTALLDIAKGIDARVAFGVKAGRGQRVSLKEKKKIVNIQLAMGWITVAIQPPTFVANDPSEAGYALTVEEACAEAATHFGLTEETLRHEWATRSEMRKVDFELFMTPKLK
jgi:hypothetical protein